MTRSLLALIAAMLFPSLAACDNPGGRGPGLVPPLPAPSGAWSVTWTNTSDTCGVDAPPDTKAVLIEIAGTRLYWSYDGQPCDTTGRFYSDASVTISQTDTVTGLDGCAYRKEVSSSIDFTESSITGNRVTTLTAIAGTDCTDYSASPCEIRTSIVGQRCPSCFTSCL